MNRGHAVRPTDVPAQGARATIVLVRAGADVATWTFHAGARCDLAVVEALARLQLAARRFGGAIELRDVPAPLEELLDLVGLAELIG